MTFLLWDIQARANALGDYFTEYSHYSQRGIAHTEMDSHLFARLYLSVAQELGVNRTLLQASLAISLILCLVLALVAQLFSRDMVQETEKKSPYECGFFPFDSATRLPFDVHFYVVGIMFLVFDVELVILTTITILAATMPSSALGSVAGFVIILTIGFVYEWNCGALRWESKIPEPVHSAPRGFAAACIASALLFSEDSLLLFYFELTDLLFSTDMSFFELLCFFWPITRLVRGKRFKKAKKGPVLRRLLIHGIDGIRRTLPKGQRWGWRWRLPQRLRIYRTCRWWRRRRQTTGSDVIPSWRVHTAKYRFVRRLPWPKHLRYNKYKKRKRFWRYSYFNRWWVRRTWTGHRSKYSYLRRLHAFLLIYCVPSIQHNFTRLHRVPLIIVMSMFLIPFVCVPAPWFLEDYDVVFRQLLKLYERQENFFLTNSRVYKEELAWWARPVVIVLSLYPAATLNIFFDYYWPSMLVVGWAVAHWWYVFTDAHRNTVLRIYRRSANARRKMRIFLRDRHLRAYEIRFQTKKYVPHPDKGYEDEYSQRLLVALLLLLPLFDWIAFPMAEPMDLGVGLQKLSDELRPYVRRGMYYVRLARVDLYTFCRAFNARGKFASLTLILCGIAFGFTGLFLPFTWRLMYPKRKLRVWPPLFSAFVLWISIRTLNPWWQHSTFPMLRNIWRGTVYDYNHGQYKVVYGWIGDIIVFGGGLVVFYIWRAILRFWHGRYWVAVTRYRRINVVSNREFARHINAVAFDPCFMSDKGLAKKRAARLASGKKIKRYMLQTRVWWYFRD